ncbi:hypothetical protein [Nocardia sp. NPDC020380]|uniref:hypothetical protein n=1 Tax=Nocardia sp. NPDC020380 TaxID=3364309 RepID=UPI00379B32BD
MTIRTQVANRGARRVQAAERVKTGAAQRAYAKRRNREGRSELPGVRRGRRSQSVPRGRMSFVATIIALLGCGLALTLLLTTRATEDSYQLGDARRANQQLSDERDALQREVASADSAPELAKRAAELGMIPAKDPARLLVGPDGQVTVVGNPQPAQGAPAPPLNTTPPLPSAQPHIPAQGERVVPVTTTPNPPPTTVANPAPANPAQPPAPPAANLAQPAANPAQPQANPVAPAPNGQAPANPAQPAANGQPPANPAPANTVPPQQNPAPVNPVQAPVNSPQPDPAQAQQNPAQAPVSPAPAPANPPQDPQNPAQPQNPQVQANGTPR